MVKLRKMSYGDLEWFKDVRKDCIQWLYEDKDYSLEEYQKWYKEDKPHFFVVNIEGDDIGYIRTSEWGKGRVKVGMDIHRNHRGKGYSVPSYQELFHSLKWHSINDVYLDVLEENERAVHIYRKLGFEEFNSKNVREKRVLQMKNQI
tara:strand:+ start:73 stop:513 length:441 start_codon:yes stop_codon:yes gene_type:complete